MLPLSHDEHSSINEKKKKLLQEYLSGPMARGDLERYHEKIELLDNIIKQRGSLCLDCSVRQSSHE